MKRRFVKIIGLLLVVVLYFLVCTSFSVGATEETLFTFSNDEISVNEGEFTNYLIEDNTLTINGSGNYRITGNCSDCNIVVKKNVEDVSLYLDNLNLTSNRTAPVVVGKNSSVNFIIENTVSLQDTIYNSKDYLINNNLVTYDSSTDTYYYNGTKDEIEAESAVMKFKDASKVNIFGEGTLNITAKAKNGIKTGATLDSDGNPVMMDPNSEYFSYLKINDITLNMNATDVYVPDSDTYGDGINCESYLSLESGRYNFNVGDDAIHSDYSVDIGKINGANSNLDINIIEAFEGIEAANVKVYSGDIDISSVEDCINGSNKDLGTYQYSVDIYGSDLYCDVSRDDGVDSNGNILISGGKIVIFSGTAFDSSPFDTGTDGNHDIDDSFGITGGEVLGVGLNGNVHVPYLPSQYWVTWGFLQSSHRTNMTDSSQVKLNYSQTDFDVGTRINISGGEDFTISYNSNEVINSKTLRYSNMIFYSGGFGDVDEFSVSFDSNNGTGVMSNISGNEGETINLSNNSFEKEGFIFDGWNTEPDGSGFSYKNGEEVTLWTNMRLYAQWRCSGSYTISYNSNGGEGSINSQENVCEAKVSNNLFTYEDRAFVSWNTKADGTGITYNEGDNISLSGDIVLYAIWSEGYLGTFNINNGSITTYKTTDYSSGLDNQTSARARNSSTGEIDITGDGQINFKVVPDEGYRIVSLEINGDYKNLKGPDDTGQENTYRITKVKSDLNITISLIKEEVIPYIINNYEVDETNSYISRIMVNTNLDAFSSNVILGEGYSMNVDTINVEGNNVLYTGSKTKILEGNNLYREFTNVVIGDLTGDGVINSADLLRLRQHLLGTKLLEGEFFLAGDSTYDSQINSADLLRLRQHLLGTRPFE